MGHAVVLVISSDDLLNEALSSLVDSINNLELESVSPSDLEMRHIDRPDLALILAHSASASDDSEDYVDVLDLLEAVRGTKLLIPVLVLSDNLDSKSKYIFTTKGVADCISFPLDSKRLTFMMDSLTLRVRFRLSKEKVESSDITTIDEDNPFLYHPDEMGRMMEDIRVIAPQESTVLLTGETGTGKTRVAKLIHDLSDRKHEPFLAINCGALSSTLIESEMFGHVKGAYTGADRDRSGKFFDVGRGTLLLDEVDALPLNSQAKLLRVVEERLFEQVGSNKSLPMRARLIVATNKDLEEEVTENRFRNDLWYRFDIVSFKLAPLRERQRVIPEMVKKFIKEIAERNRRSVTGINSETMKILKRYPWPGNIRELRNVVERCVALCRESIISVENLSDQVIEGSKISSELLEGSVDASPTLEEAKGEAELEHIMKALQNNGNNKLRAAKELGISRVTLYKKLKRYGIM